MSIIPNHDLHYTIWSSSSKLTQYIQSTLNFHPQPPPLLSTNSIFQGPQVQEYTTHYKLITYHSPVNELAKNAFGFKDHAKDIHHLPITPPNHQIHIYNMPTLTNNLLEQPMLYSHTTTIPSFLHPTTPPITKTDQNLTRAAKNNSSMPNTPTLRAVSPVTAQNNTTTSPNTAQLLHTNSPPQPLQRSSSLSLLTTQNHNTVLNSGHVPTLSIPGFNVTSINVNKDAMKKFNSQISLLTVLHRLDSILDNTKPFIDKGLNPWAHLYFYLDQLPIVKQITTKFSPKTKNQIITLSKSLPLPTIPNYSAPGFIITPIPYQILQANTQQLQNAGIGIPIARPFDNPLTSPHTPNTNSSRERSHGSRQPSHGSRQPSFDQFSLNQVRNNNNNNNNNRINTHNNDNNGSMSNNTHYSSAPFHVPTHNYAHVPTTLPQPTLPLDFSHPNIYPRYITPQILLHPLDLLHTRYLSSLASQRLISIHSTWVYNNNDGYSWLHTRHPLDSSGGTTADGADHNDDGDDENIPDLDQLQSHAMNLTLSYELLLSPLLSSQGWIFACDLSGDEQFHNFYDMLTIFLPMFLTLLLPPLEFDEFVELNDDQDEFDEFSTENANDNTNNINKNKTNTTNDSNKNANPSTVPSHTPPAQPIHYFECFDTHSHLYTKLQFLFSRHMCQIPTQRQHWRKNLIHKIRFLLFQTKRPTLYNDLNEINSQRVSTAISPYNINISNESNGVDPRGTILVDDDDIPIFHNDTLLWRTAPTANTHSTHNNHCDDDGDHDSDGTTAKKKVDTTVANVSSADTVPTLDRPDSVHSLRIGTGLDNDDTNSNLVNNKKDDSVTLLQTNKNCTFSDNIPHDTYHEEYPSFASQLSPLQRHQQDNSISGHNNLIRSRKIQIQSAIDHISKAFQDRLVVEICDLYTDVVTPIGGMNSNNNIIIPPTQTNPPTGQHNHTTSNNNDTNANNHYTNNTFTLPFHLQVGTGNAVGTELEAIHQIFNKIYLENALVVDQNDTYNPFHSVIGDKYTYNYKTEGTKGVDYDGHNSNGGINSRRGSLSSPFSKHRKNSTTNTTPSTTPRIVPATPHLIPQNKPISNSNSDHGPNDPNVLTKDQEQSLALQSVHLSSYPSHSSAFIGSISKVHDNVDTTDEKLQVTDNTSLHNDDPSILSNSPTAPTPKANTMSPSVKKSDTKDASKGKRKDKAQDDKDCNIM